MIPKLSNWNWYMDWMGDFKSQFQAPSGSFTSAFLDEYQLVSLLTLFNMAQSLYIHRSI